MGMFVIALPKQAETHPFWEPARCYWLFYNYEEFGEARQGDKSAENRHEWGLMGAFNSSTTHMRGPARTWVDTRSG